MSTKKKALATVFGLIALTAVAVLAKSKSWDTPVDENAEPMRERKVAQVVGKSDTDRCLPEAAERLVEAQRMYAADFPRGADIEVERDFFGIRLSGTDEQFALGEKILCGPRSNGLMRKLFRKKAGCDHPQSWPEVARGCHDLPCALGKVVVNDSAEGAAEAGMLLFTLAKRSGYVFSLRAQGDISGMADISDHWLPRVWELSELRRYADFFESAPKIFRRAFSLRYFYAFGAAGKTGGWADTSESGESSITITDHGKNGTGVIAHEIGHHIDRVVGKGQLYSKSREWRQLSGWKCSDGILRCHATKPEVGFVSKYAQLDPREDFAEHVMMYVFAPELLLARTPKKFAVLRDRVFNGEAFGQVFRSRPDFRAALESRGGASAILGAYGRAPNPQSLRALRVFTNAEDPTFDSGVETFYGLASSDGEIFDSIFSRVSDEVYCAVGGRQGAMQALRAELVPDLYAVRSYSAFAKLHQNDYAQDPERLRSDYTAFKLGLVAQPAASDNVIVDLVSAIISR